MTVALFCESIAVWVILPVNIIVASVLSNRVTVAAFLPDWLQWQLSYLTILPTWRRGSCSCPRQAVRQLGRARVAWWAIPASWDAAAHSATAKPSPLLIHLQILYTPFGAITSQKSVLRIHEILIWIRIRGSMTLTYGSGCGSGSCYFHHWPSRRQKKLI